MANGLQSPPAAQQAGLDDARGVRGVVARQTAFVCSCGFGYASPSGTHGGNIGLTLIQVGTVIGGRSDCILSFWNSKEEISESLSKILERITGERDKKTYQAWLLYRMEQSGKKDEKTWVLDLLDSDNGSLVRQALWAALRIAPEQCFEKLPAIAANLNLPSDVRASAIRLAPDTLTNNKCNVMWLVNLLDKEVKLEQQNIRDLLAPSHPLRDFQGMSAILDVIDGETKEDLAAPKTLADEAETKLKKLTGKDFGKDAAAWQKWIESTLPQHQQLSKGV